MNIKIFNILKKYTTKILFNISKSKFFSFVLILFLIHSTSSLIFSQTTNWQKVYKGRINNAPIYGSHLVKVDENNYFLIGVNRNYTGTTLFKLNDYGDTLFTLFYPNLKGYPIVYTGDANIVFSSRNINVLTELVKVNSSGQTIWDNYYQGSESSENWDIIKTNDDFIIVCGRVSNSGYLLKVKNNGDFVWHKAFSSFGYKAFTSLLQTNDNSYLVGGYVKDSLGITSQIVQGLLAKIDTSGAIFWEKRYLTKDSISGVRDMVILKHNEGYVMGGKIYNSDYNGNATIMFNKLDIEGNVKYSIIYPPKTNFINLLSDVKLISNNRLLFLYNRYSNNYDSLISEVFISDTLGNIIRSVSISSSSYVRLLNIFIESSNKFFLAGYSNYFNSLDYNAIVIKTDSLLLIPSIVSINNYSTTIPDKLFLKQNYPNSFNNFTQFELGIIKDGNYRIIIYDITGKKIVELLNTFLKIGSYKISFSPKDLSSGIYFVMLESEKNIFVQKIVLSK